MGQFDENLYETRTNLFSSENIIDYLWRRCEKSTYPFKPDNSFGINTKEVEKKYLRGKEMMASYVITPKDIKAADIHGGHEYNFEVVEFETVNMDKLPVSQGRLALVYKADRKYYSLFEILPRPDGQKELRLIMKVKQKVSLLGSFQTEMFYYY
ncbi:MAG: hypothetical protein K5762_05935 [Bacilli bacterium]|nr:hypothetical protein [Bacilli bacterium]